MIDWIWIIVGIALIVIGIIGCVLPVIPGPPITYISLLILNWRKNDAFSTDFLLLWAVITIAVTVVDYIVPIWGTKKLGGTKYGTWGATIGLVLGLFVFPPIGIIIGPFFGAFVGEMLSGQEGVKALKAALGAFLGFVAGTLAKLVVSIVMAGYFFVNMF